MAKAASIPGVSDRIEESEIIEILGDGSLSRVFKVWNPTLNVFRTIKMLKRSASHAAQVRFFTEMQILAQLDHDGVPRLHRVGSWNGLHFFETQFVDGDSLAELIQKNGALSPELICAIMIELSEVVQYIHTEPIESGSVRYYGILHRDIKPSNILITTTKGCRLIDFGIASLSTNNIYASKDRGRIVGSVPYLAPEVFHSVQITSKADLFSLGAVFCEMVMGTRLFTSSTMPKLLHERMTNSFEISPLFPRLFRPLLDKLIAIQPESRPYNAREVGELFRKLLKKLSGDSPRLILTQCISGDQVRA